MALTPSRSSVGVMTRSDLGVFGQAGEPTLYVTDYDGYSARLVSLDPTDMSYVASFGTIGSGNDQFDKPKSICTDGTYLYVADSGNNRIVKRLASDFSYVSKNDLGFSPIGICTDGTYVYVSGNSYQIRRHNVSDLSYVDCGFGKRYNDVYQLSTDGTYIYCNTGFQYLEKFDNATLTSQADVSISNISYLCADGTYVYYTDSANEKIVKRKGSDLSFVDDESFASSPIYGVCVDDTHLYMNYTDNYIKKLLTSDLSEVDELNGSVVPNFVQVYGICIT